MKTDTQTLIAHLRLMANDIRYTDSAVSQGLTEAADRLEGLHKQHQPKLVDENTPKDRPLLMYWPNHYGWQSGYWIYDAWYPTAAEPALCSTYTQPTHWMEMPPEPTGG